MVRRMWYLQRACQPQTDRQFSRMALMPPRLLSRLQMASGLLYGCNLPMPHASMLR
jgi:hypothetical protein